MKKKGSKIYKTNFFSTHITFQIISFFLILGFGITILIGSILDWWNHYLLFLIGIGNVVGSIILFINIIYIFLKYHPFTFYTDGIELPPLHKNLSGEHKDFLRFDEIKEIKVIRAKKVLDRKALIQNKNGKTYPIPLYHVPEEKIMSIFRDVFGEKWDSMYDEVEKKNSYN
ncbi:MAG: hypothetical protein ACOC40_01225 [Thermoplasmatota archaeon]